MGFPDTAIKPTGVRCYRPVSWLLQSQENLDGLIGANWRLFIAPSTPVSPVEIVDADRPG